MNRSLILFVAPLLLWTSSWAAEYKIPSQPLSFTFPHLAGDAGNYSGGLVDISASASLIVEQKDEEWVFYVKVQSTIKELGGDGTAYGGNQTQEVGRITSTSTVLPDLSGFQATLACQETPNQGGSPKQFATGGTPLAPPSQLVSSWSVFHDSGRVVIVLKDLTINYTIQASHEEPGKPPPHSNGQGSHHTDTSSTSMDTTQIVAASIGGFFILLLLGLVFWRRNLTAAEYTFARIVLALAVACVSVVLTGFLRVQFNGVIQASGAFAVFVIVYRLTPAGLQGSSDWQALRKLWLEQKELTNDTASARVEAVRKAVQAVNETALVIENDDSVFRAFVRDFGNEYIAVYQKLRTNRYPIPELETTSDQELIAAAKQLADRMEAENART